MQDFLLHAAPLIPLLVVLGLGAGFLAGLLGVGGGIILVPGLYFIFKTLGYDPALLMHMAVGTSLAIILPTGLSSAYAHYKKDGIRGSVMRVLAPGIVLGVAAGTWIAGRIGGDHLTFIFAAALLIFAVLMQIPPTEREGVNPDRAIGPWKGGVGGFFVGALSALMGIGGATLNVPFMTLNGVPMRQAVGTASALGPFIALPGTLGFMFIGGEQSGLPPFSLGYVNLLAFATIAPLGVLAAPWGARAAHAMPVDLLRRVFSVFIVIVAIKMLWDAFHVG